MVKSSDHTTSSRFGYSEKEMADSFEKALQTGEGINDLGMFDAIYREISCRQGRPDFIALRYASSTWSHGSLRVPGLVGPAVLKNLKPRAVRTLDYLVRNTEFARQSIRKSLRQLVEMGYVEETENGAYRLAPLSVLRKPEIWSFELKLNNPKKAVFQAQQSRAFAERAIIVVPPGQERNYVRFLGAIRRWHIGLATFDPFTCSFHLVKKGRKSQALSKTHQLYVLSKVGL